MSEKQTGGPAFPVSGADYKEGMTLRDYFAAKAMGFIMKSFMDAATKEGVAPSKEQWQMMADACYGVADSMLKARES